ncbi:MAG TPA: CoA transferase subunit A [Chloroflexi bacterium]|nr:CoA transferase subunit A [Chloroflexota bacterium]
MAASQSKLITMTEAVERLVPNGSSVAIGLALEGNIPFAAGHEIIRQRRRDLTLIGPISDMLFDQLISAGCVAEVIAAWVGNVSAGLAHGLRRAVEKGIPRSLSTRDHSNFSMSLALKAAALGAPFIPTRSLLGSDLPHTNPDLIEITNPLNEHGEPLLLVRALRPDVAVVHVQRADETGNAHLWGTLGITEDASLAARQVILVAEEIVRREVILSDPNRIFIPAFKVSAVVHEPGGAHPSPVQGYYNRHHDFYHDYHAATRSHDGFEQWAQEWVYSLPNRTAYLEHLAGDTWQSLQKKHPALAASIDYGY